jgi:hypothetical protein
MKIIITSSVDYPVTITYAGEQSLVPPRGKTPIIEQDLLTLPLSKGLRIVKQ